MMYFMLCLCAVLEIGFAEASYTVDEGHGHVRVCAEILSLEALELQRVIEFRLTTSDGSATGIKINALSLWPTVNIC